MDNINVPSYNSLALLETRKRAIQDLYDYISRWKQETDTSLEESLPKVHDYTSWNSAGTTEEGAGIMLVYDQSDRIAIMAATDTYTITNMPIGIEMYISSDAVLDGETLITVYEDTALTVDSNIMVKISAARDATIGEAFDIVYYLSRNEAIQFADTEIKAASVFQQNFSAIMALAMDPNSGVTIDTTNAEYKIAWVDNQSNVLIGKKQDDSWYFSGSLDTILDTIISNL